MKKQLLLALGLVALLSAFDMSAYHAYGNNYTKYNIKATLKRNSGGWVQQDLAANSGFDIGDGDRGFGCIEFEPTEGPQTGRKTEICRGNQYQNWDGIVIEERVRNGTPLVAVNGQIPS